MDAAALPSAGITCEIPSKHRDRPKKSIDDSTARYNSRAAADVQIDSGAIREEKNDGVPTKGLALIPPAQVFFQKSDLPPPLNPASKSGEKKSPCQYDLLEQ